LGRTSWDNRVTSLLLSFSEWKMLVFQKKEKQIFV
jgi:hypothetical protein